MRVVLAAATLLSLISVRGTAMDIERVPDEVRGTLLLDFRDCLFAGQRNQLRRFAIFSHPEASVRTFVSWHDESLGLVQPVVVVDAVRSSPDADDQARVRARGGKALARYSTERFDGSRERWIYASYPDGKHKLHAFGMGDDIVVECTRE